MHRGHDLLVRQHLIGVLHPLFAKITHLLGDQPIAKAELRPPHLNHLAAPRAFDAALDVAAHD
ncbi:hypothetical protein IVB12_07980 [Bradyrhizobium sp. 179]|uniref:hypothetical protein n=1 Tax=Bradyrhizobium sp. 179 TaxID=2782648 RepID=UPI001FF7F5F1|nr:hypothetical protein [Bradyrhizobium sp. 179]MCK1541911.1 hypothetical protein [Bradyrhizobium sp. 179]